MSDRGSRAGSGTGAAFGARIMQHSSVHLGGLFLVHLLTFASALVVAHELGPANFGRFGLLLFFASLITLLFKIATKRGTYMQVFGGDDDDDDDDEEDLETVGDRDRILGNGIFLSIALTFVVTAIVWPFSTAIADLLLGDGADGMLIVWATLAGGFEGVWTLTSNVVRLERRPVSFVLLSAVRPILLLAAVVAFILAGAGLEGAIAAWAIGTAVSAAIAMVAIRPSYEVDLDPHIAISIFGRGYVRIPIIVSYWTVGHADKFIVSRFVSPTDLGIYQLASMTAFLLAAVPAAFFKAWRPLKRSMTFAAVDDHYGVGVARGAMLTYFGLTVITALLAVTLFSPAIVHLAPASFESAANYIPLLAAGALAPYVLRAMNKAGTLQSKRRFYTLSVVAAAIAFVALAFVLVPVAGARRGAARDGDLVRGRVGLPVSPLADRSQAAQGRVPADRRRVRAGRRRERRLLPPRPRGVPASGRARDGSVPSLPRDCRQRRDRPPPAPRRARRRRALGRSPPEAALRPRERPAATSTTATARRCASPSPSACRSRRSA